MVKKQQHTKMLQPVSYHVFFKLFYCALKKFDVVVQCIRLSTSCIPVDHGIVLWGGLSYYNFLVSSVYFFQNAYF